MKKITREFVVYLSVLFLFTIAFGVSAAAQIARPLPELTVNGFRLGGDEEAARKLLQNYSPRYDNERSQPKYLFYNQYGNQVMALTGFSKERPFLIVAAEVFGVGQTYQAKHFQMKDKSYFETESAFFIGTRPSASSMIFGVANMTGPKDVINKKGAPDADEKNGKKRVLRYSFNAPAATEAQKVKLQETALKSAAPTSSPLPVFGSYKAEYHFVKNKLRRFVIAIETADSGVPIF